VKPDALRVGQPVSVYVSAPTIAAVKK